MKQDQAELTNIQFLKAFLHRNNNFMTWDAFVILLFNAQMPLKSLE